MKQNIKKIVCESTDYVSPLMWSIGVSMQRCILEGSQGSDITPTGSEDDDIFGA